MRKLDFATTLTDSQSYIGEQALQYILAAFLKNKTADAGATIVQDIKQSAYVAKLSGSNLVKIGDNCTFSASGTLVAAEVQLTPKTMFINIELCYNDLEALWNAVDSANQNTQDLTADFNSALQGVLIDAMNTSFEDAIWNGVYDATGTTVTALFNGIDAQITTHALTGSTWTKSNIVADIDRLVGALPEAVLENPQDLKIFMNNKSKLLYQQALMSLGFNTPADAMPSTYDGFEIYTIGKIADNKAYAIQPKNIAIGVGAMDNFAQLQILDMRQTTGDNSIRMKLQGKVDVKLVYEAEAVSVG
jgi:hypothetical protein